MTPTTLINIFASALILAIVLVSSGASADILNSFTSKVTLQITKLKALQLAQDATRIPSISAPGKPQVQTRPSGPSGTGNTTTNSTTTDSNKVRQNPSSSFNPRGVTFPDKK